MQEAIQTLPNYWGSFELQPDTIYRKIYGELELYIRYQEPELHVAHIYRNNNHAEDVTSVKMEWQRWTFQKNPKTVKILPLVPDRPLVITPEYPFNMVRGGESKIYVRMPVWVGIYESDIATLITDLPSALLTNTWFGSLVDGEMCYGLSSGARLKVEPDPDRPYLAICPIHIVNQSAQNLPVERIAIRVTNLSLYQDESGQLWCNPYRIHFKGRDEIGEIKITNKPPAEAVKARRISPPREKEKLKQLMRSFDLQMFGMSWF